MTLHRGIRHNARRNKVTQAVQSLIEGLEERRLLTRVFAGESMVYNSIGSVPVRVLVSGDEGTYVDFIGANLDETGGAALADVPATIYEQGNNIALREALGGFAGGNGIDTAKRITTGVAGSSFTNVAGDRRPFDALATNAKGATYEVSRLVVGDNSTAIQVLSVNNTNGNSSVVDDITSEIVSSIDSTINHPADPEVTADDFTSADIVSVYAADFKLGSNVELYFIMRANIPVVTGQSENGSEFGDVEVSVMMRYNRDSGAVTRIGYFGLLNEDNSAEVSDFTFINSTQIMMFGTLDDEDEPALYRANITTLQPVFVARVVEGLGDDEEDITELNAIEYVPSLNAVLAVNEDRLMRINVSNAPGRARELGTLIDPDVGDADPARGASVFDLSWNATQIDNYFAVGSKGVLLGTDTETNELVGIDVRDRFAEISLYAIVSDRTNENTTISISVVEPNDDVDDNPALAAQLGDSSPFDGGSGGISVVEVDPGMDNPTVIDTGNDGGLFMGLRTLDADDAPTIPVLMLDSRRETEGGDFIGSKQQVPGLPTNFSPGVYLENSIGDFLFSGTITGKVNIQGSVDFFYAGNILTGHPRGRPPVDVNISDDNFVVEGDLRTLIANNIGALEGQPDAYNPETDIHIKGRLGSTKSQFEFNASVEVNANDTDFPLNESSFERETIVNRSDSENELIGRAFDAGSLANQPITNNDTFDTAELLTTHDDEEFGADSVNHFGVINLSSDEDVRDAIDFYQLPLMAGQKISVQFLDLGLAPSVDLVVIDPEGREYASNRSNVDNFNYAITPFEVKIDKPGSWRFQVRPNTDDEAPAALYQIIIRNVGNLSFGGMVSMDRISMRGVSNTLRVHNGDMGTIQATGVFDHRSGVEGSSFSVGNSIQVNDGNLREIDGESISVFQDDVYTRYPNFLVPDGSVGRIHSDTFGFFNNRWRSVSKDSVFAEAAIGGDYQLIDIEGEFSANLVANGGIGVLRAGEIATTILTFPGYYAVDVDGRGRDGFIDLIDSGGGIGRFDYGGPAIRVGRAGGGGDGGGNIRFMRAGGNIYRDFFFGSGSTAVRTSVDESVELTDDSGARITLTPIARGRISQPTSTGGSSGSGVPSPFGNFTPPDPFGRDTIDDPFGGGGANDNPFVIDGEIIVSTYSIRSGGVVVNQIDVEEGGLLIQTEERGGSSRGEIGVINFADDDTAGITVPPVQLFRNPSERGTLRLASGNSRELTVTGAPTGIFQVNVGTSGAGNLTRLENFTKGEIVNVAAADVGEIIAENLGFAIPSVDTRVEGLPADTTLTGRLSGRGFENGLNSYPFNDQRNFIVLDNSINIAARRSLGNVALTGIAQDVVANYDKKNETKVTEGIVGPVVTMQELRNVEIGEGLMPSGSGNVGFAGLYSANDIGRVTNKNGGGDIRGDIIAAEYVEQIKLTGSGSIINSDIYAMLGSGVTLVGITYTGFNNGRETIRFAIDAYAIDPRIDGVNGIGSVQIEGNGGMISTLMQALDFGKITIDNGFGVINCRIGSSSGAAMDGITTGGFGIRGSTYEGGSFVRVLEATGDGELLDVNDFDSSVRSSAGHTFDQFDGTFLTATNDLHMYMGTDSDDGSLEGVTESGVIENSVISANRTLDRVDAWRIRSRTVEGVEQFEGIGDAFENTESERFVMRINFGDKVGEITTLDDIDGLRIVGGEIDTIDVGAAMRRTRMIVSGRIENVKVARDIKGNSYILANGSSGEIVSLTTGGMLSGVVTASVGMGTIKVGTDLSSRQIRSFGSIQSLIVGGDVREGTYVRASNRLNVLTIGDDFRDGATIRAKTFGTVTIGGDEDGDLVEK